MVAPRIIHMGFVVLAACGGREVKGAGDVDSGIQVGDGSAVTDGTTNTACTAAGGASICGGSATACSAALTSQTCNCEVLANVIALGGTVRPNDVSVCGGTELPRTRLCADGEILVAAPASSVDTAVASTAISYVCAPFEDAELYAASGWARAVLYADYSDYTGNPLPSASSCPAVPGVTLCGGACGSCDQGLYCTGRSPVHPYSFCVPDLAADESATASGQHGFTSCGPGYGCFAYSVQVDAQPLANDDSFCLPEALCEAATNIPGGGMCDTTGGLAGGWTDCFPR